MSAPAVFTTCPFTGRKVHDTAGALTRANAVVSVVALCF